MARFSGQSVVITGGTNGIGLAVAQRVVGEGGRVLVTGLNDERLAAAKAFHTDIHILRNDSADPKAADSLAAEVKKVFGEVDAVLLHAGVGVFAPLGEITPELYRRQFDLNVGGVLFGAQALAPLIKRGGTLVLTASGVKTKGVPGSALYAGSKGAVRSIALVLARELGPRDIRVNTVSPGPINTSFHARVVGLPPELEAKIGALLKGSIPMGRLGSVDEAAAVVTFLLSNESSFVTGADYPVDGGEAQL
jgi:NAD(P)-dependent dehydrogenase (short-subunit alcohol dehydrogenase family)